MRLSSPLAVAIAASAVVAACAADGESTTTAPQSPERFAIATLTWSRADSPALAAAYFIEHAPGERGALIDYLHIPGARVAFDASVAADSCIVTHPTTPSGAVLLDAGELTVESADGEGLLDASYIPDGYMQVAGLAYEGRLDFGDRSGTFELVAEGSDEVGPFSVSLEAPPRVKLIAIDGEAIARGRVDVDIEASDGLSVAWEGPESPYEGLLAEDVAVVTFERRGFGDEWTVACAVKDDGAFTIPAAALHGLPDLGADATDRIIVRRLAGASFAATGIPDGLALAIAEDSAYVD